MWANSTQHCSTFLDKGNANQNDIEISSHPSQNDYHQENKQKQMLAKLWEVEKKEALYTVGENVN
jgi:hypothetical protein